MNQVIPDALAHRERFIVAAGVEIVRPDGRLLMIRQERSGQIEWGGVGGTLERNESLTECAVREAFEESGLRVQIDRVLRLSEFWEDGAILGIAVLFLAHPDPWPQSVRLAQVDGSSRFLEHRWCDRAEVLALPELWDAHIARRAWPTEIGEVVIDRLEMGERGR